MPGAIQAVPGYDIHPSAEKKALASNYITDFDFMNQYLPDTYEKEFERYGNRSISSFLRMVSAELPSTSDMIKWSEQGRLHIKYNNCSSDAAAAADTATITVSDSVTTIGIRIGQTVFLSDNDVATNQGANKGIVTAVNYTAGTFDVAYYEGGGQAFAATDTVSVFVYGSEFNKGTNGMVESVEPEPVIFENSPIIIKDKYAVNGSDMAQIGWIEVTTENGASGYLWYIKAEHETRLRFDDYLEMSMIEGNPAEAASGALAAGYKGTDGLFYTIGDRGNVWGGGNPTTLSDFDSIVQRLDKQGSIEENALFVKRDFSFDIDDMLGAVNAGYSGGASYGLFNNERDMALNLGFSGFRRGYDFYKSDWKYLNDASLRGDIIGGAVNGVLVPAGTTSVYDMVLGKNAKRPFLHVRYRASETENRRYKTWMTGSAGGATTSDLDAMEVHFLSERVLCTLGANNFFLFEG